MQKLRKERDAMMSGHPGKDHMKPKRMRKISGIPEKCLDGSSLGLGDSDLGAFRIKFNFLISACIDGSFTA